MSNLTTKSLSTNLQCLHNKLALNITQLEALVAPYVPGSKSLADSPESLLISLREYVKETKKLLGIDEYE